MNNKELRKVGKVKSSHGIKGEVYVLIFAGDLSWLDRHMTFYIAGKAYQVNKFRPHKDGIIASLQGVVDRNQSDTLAQQEVWVDLSLFESDEGEAIYLVEIENFQIIDQGLEIGRIIGFSSNGIQDLLIVQSPTQQQYEIPFVDEFINHIDYQSQKIDMTLPEGLLQINSSSESDEQGNGRNRQ